MHLIKNIIAIQSSILQTFTKSEKYRNHNISCYLFLQQNACYLSLTRSQYVFFHIYYFQKLSNPEKIIYHFFHNDPLNYEKNYYFEICFAHFLN